jgi:holo-[acyl-carrier protein] synthase
MNLPILRTGIDLVEINRLETINPAIRRRFIQRVYTPIEITECAESWASYAGRFAAKEAVAKALGSGLGPVAWKEIEIRRAENGEPILSLYGKAKQYAYQHGLSQWSISISHSRSHAVAVAIAMGPANPV